MTGFFIAGTDTEIGKTLVTGALFHALTEQGRDVELLKWVSAGAEQQGDAWFNEDGLHLQSLYEQPPAYERINPIVLPEPASPHIAADLVGKAVRQTDVVSWHQQRVTSFTSNTLFLAEGAGGWFTPLNPSETLADVVVALQLPVILVVGMRLGCLNHAMLTAASVRQAGLPLAGWVANVIDPNMRFLEKNMAYLQKNLACPFLGEVPYLDGQVAESWQQKAQLAAQYLSVEGLL